MLKILHMYPDLLNLYGDRGNIIALKQRCAWRNINAEVKEINLNTPVNFKDADIIFIGGGSDREQQLVAGDLLKHKDKLVEAIEDGIVILAVCGGYQMLGSYYRASDGTKIEGLSVFDFFTESGNKRLIGDIVIEVKINGQLVQIAGFENHAGKTHLNNIEPFGRVVAGCGNNGIDGREGARYKNTFCTYLHGPLLPKNPELTDYLILLALQRKGYNINKLTPLPGDIEYKAREVVKKKLNIS